MIGLIRQAMQDPEGVVIEMRYRDSFGHCTRRVVSPIRFVGETQFLALCLCREEPRRFMLDRCHAVRIVASADVLMPIEIQEVEHDDHH